MRKKPLQKEQFITAEGTGNLIGDKIGDKITSVSKKSTKELSNNETGKEDVKNNYS